MTTPTAPMDLLGPTLLMACGAGLAVAAALAPAWWPDEPDARSAPAVHGSSAGEAVEIDPGRSLTLRGLAVLRRWDERRAAAYRAGAPERLAALYVPASQAGHRDRQLLLWYAERGLRVRGVVPQVRRVEVAAPSPGRLRVRVEERFPRMVVEPVDTRDGGRTGGRTGTERPARELAGEHDYRERVVVLRRTPEGWRVVSARRR